MLERERDCFILSEGKIFEEILCFFLRLIFFFFFF